MDGWTDTGFRCLNAVPTQRNPVPVSSVTAAAFDSVQDLLWTGDFKGRLASYRQGLQRYTAFKSHESEVREILTNSRGLISLSSDGVRINNRRGIVKQVITDNDEKYLRGLHTMTFSTRGTNDIITAGQGAHYTSINLDRGCVVDAVERPTVTASQSQISTILKMKRSSHAIVTGSSQGSVEILDPSTLKLVHKFQAHMGPIADMDAKQHLVITCGFSQRKTGYMPDPLINVYDVRAMRSLPPVAFPAGAAFVRIHPKLTTSCVIASLTGQLQFVDLANPTSAFLQQAALSSYLVNMDISSSGDYISLIDEDGFIQLWGGPATTAGVGTVNFTDFSASLEFPTSEDPIVEAFDVDNQSRTLSAVGMPFYKEELFSSWSDPKVQVFNTGMPPPVIDSSILSQVKITPESIAHAPYNIAKHGHRNIAQSYTSLNQVRKSSVAVPKFISEKARTGASEDQDMLLADDDDEVQDNTKRLSKPNVVDNPLKIDKRSAKIPKVYRKLQIKYSKFGVHDFDFDFYNKTQYAGLETQISNSYCNALLQLYRHSPYIFNLAIDSCCKESYITDNASNLLVQLGYLFDMLHKADGNHCQASNFLNTLNTIPQASALGLLHEDENSISLGSKKLHAGALRQHQKQLSQSQSHSIPIHTQEEEALAILSDASEGKILQAFMRFLMEKLASDEKSLKQELDGISVEALCGVQVSTSERSLICGMETRRDYYSYVLDLIPAKSTSTRDFLSRLENGLDRYTQYRGWCEKCKKYQLMGKTSVVRSLPKVLNISVNDEPLTVTGSSQHSTGKTGSVNTGLDILPQFSVKYGKDKISIRKLQEFDDYDVAYELLGYVCEISYQQNFESHLVSIIKIESKWYLFNDFLVKEIEERDALDFDAPWKNLVLLLYQDSRKPEFHHVEKQRLNDELLYVDKFIPADTMRMMNYKKSYELLTREEAPLPGTMVAIDAEFVMLRDEDIEIRADGTKLLLKPKSLALARVSVLRYDTGVPFIDDYIESKAEILDYLTEYSGIEPGDLFVSTSDRPLVTLETAYRRLWLLLNLGCIFIGHGLINDFRTINIQVPPEQIRDTLDIYYVASRQRKLSLKFLAWYLLDEKVQKGNHDSIEDANTALLLYKKYLELKEQGMFEHKLQEIYIEGSMLNFKPPSV